MSLPSIAIGLAVLIGAIIIDILFGEARPYVHPVSLVGRLTNFLDKYFRAATNKVISGFFFLIFILLAASIPVYLVLYVSFPLTIAYVIIAMIILKGTFSITSMGDVIKPIIRALQNERIGEARVFLSKIVRRDISSLEPSGIASAAIETISRSLTYEVVSPLLFFSIFGIMGAFVVRVVNVIDKIIGHKDSRDFEFGRWAAIAHTAINYIPARLCSFFIILGSEILNYRVQSVPLRTVRALTDSTNMGWPMGAMATSLNLRLEKVGHYVLNEKGFEPSVGDIKRALNVYYISVYMFVILIVIPIMIVMYLL